MSKKTRWHTGLVVATTLLMVIDLWLILIYAPRERVMGDVQRIFYFHMPLAWNALLAFSITFAYSIRYLRTRSARHDRLAAVSAELGTVFTTLTLITGSLWARSAWGTYWTWEPRLTTAFILWLMYIFYLILRRYIEDRERARLISSAYGIVGFINVPIVFMSIRWWRTVHPVLIEPGGVKMDPPMALTLFFSLFAFTVFYLLLLRERVRLARLEEGLATLKERLKEAVR
ncbi:MAG: cytochrome c biogenesis protein [Candidatus Bipolaricaulia bacterium]